MWREFFQAREKGEVAELTFAGIVSGGIAGIGAMMFAMIAAVGMGWEVWMPLKMVAAAFMDPGWLDQTGFQFTPVLTGVMLYFGTALLLGMAFSLLGGRLSHGRATGWGIAYGLLLWWLFMQFGLKIVNPTVAEQMPLALSVSEWVVFGALLGLYPTFLSAKLGDAERAGRRAA